MKERGYLRLPVRGWADLLEGETPGARCRLEDLSRRGALLGRAAAGWPGGRAIALRCLGQRVDLRAVIVWSQLRGHDLYLGVRFSGSEAALTRPLGRMVLAVATRIPWADVVVADDDLTRRGELAERFWARGCEVVEVGDAAAVPAQLTTQASHPRFVVIGDIGGPAIVSSLSAILHRDFPDVRRVLVGTSAAAPDQWDLIVPEPEGAAEALTRLVRPAPRCSAAGARTKGSRPARTTGAREAVEVSTATHQAEQAPNDRERDDEQGGLGRRGR